MASPCSWISCAFFSFLDKDFLGLSESVLDLEVLALVEN